MQPDSIDSRHSCDRSSNYALERSVIALSERAADARRDCALAAHRLRTAQPAQCGR
jgi:hypothetical protein